MVCSDLSLICKAYNPGRVRTWWDKSKTYSVEAELFDYANGKIYLHKANGVKIAIATDKMSYGDLRYVEQIMGGISIPKRPSQNEGERSTSPSPF